jgi:trimethylamine:corrinoid methyltransferase-like protein
MDTAKRAHLVAKRLLETYEPPSPEPGVEEALRDYVARRKKQLRTGQASVT